MSFLRLQYTRSDGEIDTYHLKAGRRYNVGRGSTCEVRILDMRLSRKHCAVECINGSWVVADLGSTNGCKIHKKRIETSVPVNANTIVTLGSVEIFIATISDHLDSGETEHEPIIESGSDEYDAEDTTDNVKANALSSVVAEESIDEDATEDEPNSKSSSSEYSPSTSHIKNPAVVKKGKQPEVDKSDTETEAKTVFISALGKKVGPISRSQAKELKKRELQGALTEEDLDKILNEVQ